MEVLTGTTHVLQCLASNVTQFKKSESRPFALKEHKIRTESEN